MPCSAVILLWSLVGCLHRVKRGGIKYNQTNSTSGYFKSLQKSSTFAQISSTDNKQKAIMKYIVFVLMCISVCWSFPSNKPVQKPKDDNHWDYLILSQFWPESSCIYFKEKGDECYIPSDVRGWTIHGLWPSRPDSTVYPHDCNDSMEFDMSKIQVLRPKLDLKWHFYEKDSDPTYLWKHEWTKHGTCAFSLPALRGELTYFNKTLELHSHVNLTQALAKSMVLPSNTQTYKREDFFNAVHKFYGVKPFIVCDWDSDVRKSYIDQIYLCYDKSFQQQDCYPSQDSSASSSALSDPGSYYLKCEEQDQIYYLPYNKKHNKENKRMTDRSSSLKFQSERSKH